MPQTGPVLLLLALLAEPPQPAGPIDVVVTAAAPVDSQRLADAIRSYLDEYGIRVEIATASEASDLRLQLSDARRVGEAVRAMAVVRAQAGPRGTIEIELIDLATDKTIITEVPRPPRDEDLYRALALKIEASLRSTLSEAPERLGARAAMARLASSPPPAQARVTAGPPPPPALAPAPAPVALETGYLFLSFPLGGVQLQGLSVTIAFAPRPWCELTLGSAALGSVRASGRDVVAVATVVPVLAAARVHLSGRRLEALFGPLAEVAYVGVTPSSATTSVRPATDWLPALGLEVEGRLRLGAMAWAFAHVAALGVLVGEGYRVDGQLILDTSRLELAASVGLGVRPW